MCPLSQTFITNWSSGFYSVLGIEGLNDLHRITQLVKANSGLLTPKSVLLTRKMPGTLHSTSWDTLKHIQSRSTHCSVTCLFFSYLRAVDLQSLPFNLKWHSPVLLPEANSWPCPTQWLSCSTPALPLATHPCPQALPDSSHWSCLQAVIFHLPLKLGTAYRPTDPDLQFQTNPHPMMWLLLTTPGNHLAPSGLLPRSQTLATGPGLANSCHLF